MVSKRIKNQIKDYESKMRAREARFRYNVKKKGITDAESYKGAYGTIRYNYQGKFLINDYDAKKYLKDLKKDYKQGVGLFSLRESTPVPSSLRKTMKKVKNEEKRLNKVADNYNEQAKKLTDLKAKALKEPTSDARTLKSEKVTVDLTGYKNTGSQAKKIEKVSKKGIITPYGASSKFKQNYLYSLDTTISDASRSSVADKSLVLKLMQLNNKIKSMSTSEFAAMYATGLLKEIKEFYKKDNLPETVRDLEQSLKDKSTIEKSIGKKFKITFPNKKKYEVVNISSSDIKELREYSKNYTITEFNQ